MGNLIPLLCLLSITNYVSIATTTDDPIVMVVSAEGYKNEIHRVTTADHYILKLYRILPAKRFLRPVGAPVLLVHGMVSSGFQYILTGPGIPKALSFKLADNGYDVWLINCRCVHITQHLDIPQTSAEFWKFSFHEIAKYDLPAVIDYVLAKTNRTFVHYVGHSQGTTVVMAMLSMFPRYNRKLKTLHLLAPSVYFANAPIALKSFVPFSEPLQRAFASAGIHSLPGITPELAIIGGYLCSTQSIMTLNIYSLMDKERNEDLLPLLTHYLQAITIDPTMTHILRNMFSSVSAMQLLHFSQLIKSGEFQQYDHKMEKNLLIYNQPTPPYYRLSNVKTKIHFLYGTTDLVTNYRDVERLMREFRPWTIGVDKIIGYNHFDLVAAKSIDELVNTKILNLIKKYGHGH